MNLTSDSRHFPLFLSSFKSQLVLNENVLKNEGQVCDDHLTLLFPRFKMLWVTTLHFLVWVSLERTTCRVDVYQNKEKRFPRVFLSIALSCKFRERPVEEKGSSLAV